MRSIASVAIVWDALSTADAASAETGAAGAAAVASIGGVIEDVARIASSMGLRVDRVPLADADRFLGALRARRT